MKAIRKHAACAMQLPKLRPNAFANPKQLRANQRERCYTNTKCLGHIIIRVMLLSGGAAAASAIIIAASLSVRTQSGAEERGVPMLLRRATCRSAPNPWQSRSGLPPQVIRRTAGGRRPT